MKALNAVLERVLRLPPPPEPPAGSPDSLRVVRASERFVAYRQVQWLLGHAGFFVFVLLTPVLMLLAAATGALGPKDGDGPPAWAAALLVGLAAALVLGWGVFAALSLLLVRLDQQWRTYLLTDRSLRVREGLWTVREMTLTFRNVQNISVSQGPIERLFRIASLKVETAGGGGTAAAQAGHNATSGHAAVLRGLDGAEALRDELVAAVRRARGEPDARQAPAPTLPIEALRAAAAEARALRLSLVPAPPGPGRGTARLLALLATAVLAATAAPRPVEAAPHRALFVGNSYTYFNDAGSLPKRYAALQTALGASPVVAESATKGGWTFAKHLQDAQTPGEALAAALGESWDVVWLQGQSQIPGFVGIPGGPFPAEEQAFVALAKLVAPKAVRLALLVTWGRRDGDVQNASLFPDFATMQSRLDKGVATLAQSAAAAGVQVDVVPIGAAFAAIHAGGAGDDSLFARLYAADGSHPSPLGSHLAALCCVAALTGADVTKLPAPTDLDAADVKALAEAADGACRPAPVGGDDAGSTVDATADSTGSDDSSGSDSSGSDSSGSDSSEAKDSDGDGGDLDGSDAKDGDRAREDGCSARPAGAAPRSAMPLWLVAAPMLLLLVRRRGRDHAATGALRRGGR